jgi:Na+-transporting NADH:ubiquinone oxidoreductase subunit NqrB
MATRSDRQRPVRWYRTLQVGAVVLGVLVLVVAVALLLAGSADWWLLALVGVLNIVTAASTLRALRRLDPPELGSRVEERPRPER